ncbi:hypothetical protein F5146DRAFT_1006760 [Armillaria mellea]|nr:hypothetical protein F5146DRAFT_1006760 [Armillaria mellea]
MKTTSMMTNTATYFIAFDSSRVDTSCPGQLKPGKLKSLLVPGVLEICHRSFEVAGSATSRPVITGELHPADDNPKIAAKMPHTALVPPRAAFDEDAPEFPGLLTVVGVLEPMALATIVVPVSDEREQGIDVPLKDSDVLVDVKVQKLWERVSIVGRAFWHTDTTQSVNSVANSVLCVESAELVYIRHVGGVRISCKQ